MWTSFFFLGPGDTPKNWEPKEPGIITKIKPLWIMAILALIALGVSFIRDYAVKHPTITTYTDIGIIQKTAITNETLFSNPQTLLTTNEYAIVFTGTPTVPIGKRAYFVKEQAWYGTTTYVTWEGSKRLYAQ